VVVDTGKYATLALVSYYTPAICTKYKLRIDIQWILVSSHRLARKDSLVVYSMSERLCWLGIR
jgi:hypothetical protein